MENKAMLLRELLADRELRVALLEALTRPDSAFPDEPVAPPPPSGDWVVKGVRFPEGTFFRTWFVDRPYWGQVKGGALWINDKAFNSPSAAAESIFKRPSSGWVLWEAKMPGSRRWVCIADLRSEAASPRGKKGPKPSELVGAEE